MCGIFGYIGEREDAAKLVFKGLKSLEYRGYDSWGVAVVGDKIEIKKKAGKIGDNDVKELPEGNIAIGHTRWATHGGVTDINSHPHLDCTGEIAVIHNGIFENYGEFKSKLIKRGHKFVSGTDTEVIAHMLENSSVEKVFNQMDGLNAIIVINKNKNEIVAARNGSPLVVGFGKNENFLASDAAALLTFTRNVYFLEDDEMAVLTKEKVVVTNIKNGKKVNYKKQKLDWKITEGEKGKYKHFMLKEICEQPKIISNIALTGWNPVKKIASLIKKAKNVYLVGCGTASYAALAGSYLFSKIAKVNVDHVMGSEFGYQMDFISKKSLIIPISQSGETIDILEPVKEAKEKGAKIVSLVNVLGSSLYRLSDEKILISAGPEKAVASTKAFTAMLSHLILLAYALYGNVANGERVLKLAVKSTNEVLSKSSINKVRNLAKILKDKKDVYIIGRGLSYPAALETALKIKEISYIHAEGMATGELKHGPLALVEKGVPCIAFLPNDETYSANLAGAMEMKARGGFLIGISYKPSPIFDYFIKVDDAKEGTIIPNVVVAQLLAYYLTTEKKLDPDMPRNLAKSVTVK